MTRRRHDDKTLDLDFAKAMDAREQGIERAAAHANAVESEWTGQALGLLVAFAKEYGKPFLIEQARKYAEENGLPLPPDARSWGAVTRRASAKKRIEKTGNVGAAASSNCSLKPLWRYCASSGATAQ